MQGVHAQAQAIIAFGRFARKQGLYSVCLEALARYVNYLLIHKTSFVPRCLRDECCFYDSMS